MANILDTVIGSVSTRGALVSIKPLNLLSFQFNPRLKHSMRPNWATINAVHSDLPLGVFTSMGDHDISFDLWYDADTMAYLRVGSASRVTRQILNRAGGLLDVMARLQALVEPVPVGSDGMIGQNIGFVEVPLQAPEVYFVYGLRPPMRVRVDSLDWDELEHDAFLRPIRVKASIKAKIVPDSLLWKANKIAMIGFRASGVADEAVNMLTTTLLPR